MKKNGNVETIYFPESRIFTIDVCDLGLKKHHISEHKEAHAFLKGRKSMLIFDDIDISITIKKNIRVVMFRCPML